MKAYRTLTTLIFILLFTTQIFCQGNIGINATGASPDASAMLDVSSSTKGILIPRMSSTQRTSITNPAAGLMVYDTNKKSFWYYDGSVWINIKDSDGSSSNELQTISKSGSTVTLSDGGGSFTDEVNDSDFDPLNEIQTLSKTGNSIILTNGGGSVNDDTGPFEEVNNAVRLLTQTDDLILGRNILPTNGETISDNFLLFDNSKSALRGGRLFLSKDWSPDSTGTYSFAYGYNPKAKGTAATAIGRSTNASGRYSFAAGGYTISPSGYETALGYYNTEYTPASTIGWNINDRLFVIGNGSSGSNRQDAFSIMKNGNATLQGLFTLTDGTDSYTLPNTDGLLNQILQTDGAGNLSWVNDGDTDSANELQTLSYSGGNLDISNGNTVDISSLENIWNKGSGSDIYYSSKVGIGSSSSPSSKLLVRQVAGEDGIKVEHNYTGSAQKVGIDIDLTSNGSGSKTGLYSQVQAGSAGSSKGISTYVIAGSSGTHSGMSASISGAGTAIVGTALDASGVAAKLTGPSHLIGNVAIGTDEEMGALHIHETTNTNAQVFVTPNSPSNNGTSSIFLAEDSDASLGMEWKFNGVSNKLELLGKVNATIYGPHLYIDRASGDMALGSSNFADGYKLSVDGKMACEEVLVELSTGWPDYVFQDDYKLISIEDLDAFIQKEKHLPGIAPAQEMESKGLELGEMQKILTEKVEELSLYIIQLHDQNLALQKRIESLESYQN